MRETLCRKQCCTVKWCPLVTSWATTIHKFQGFEAGNDKKDMFRYLICDPGNVTWEQTCPGAFYVALSRAKTMGDFDSDTSFPKNSAIYWINENISSTRIREGGLKKGPRPGDPKVKCELLVKRDQWIKYLEKCRDKTIKRTFTTDDVARMKKTRFTPGEVRNNIADIITNPNETWYALKKDKFLTNKTFFGTR